MRVTLEVKTGLMIGRRFDVHHGTPSVFGRSDKCTFMIPHDPLMAAEHFSLECAGGGWRVRSLAPDATTTRNGEPFREAMLAEGDRLVAGRTAFLVARLEACAVAAGPPDPEKLVAIAPAPRAAGAAAPVPPPEKERTGPELLEWLGLDEDAQKLAAPGQSAAEMLGTFASREAWPVAVRLQAHLLEPRRAVRWGVLCARAVLGSPAPAAEESLLAAAERWTADPSDANRRAAEAAAKVDGMKSLAAWLCQAAFWSGGSLAPPDLPAVPPDSRLTGQALSGMSLMAAVHGDPAKAPERFRRFLVLAKESAPGR